MAARATPFGLCSGVSMAQIARESSLELAPRVAYRRRTRIDNDYLFALLDGLSRSPDVRTRLHYRLNGSLYATAGRLRYAETRLEGKERSYHLVAIEPTPYLCATLDRSRHGARLDELASALAADAGVSAEEAAD